MKIALFATAKPQAEAKIAALVGAMPGVSLTDMADDVDMVLSVGGDGTFLRAASTVGNRAIPILGINAGRLGFLADVSLDEAADVLPDILTGGRYSVERRANIAMSVAGDATVAESGTTCFALNEVAILKHEQSSMVSVTVQSDGSVLGQYDADGLVVATPTGSTAYAMSAGGPILEPHCGCLTLVAIAPHSLTTRPLVIRDTARLDITVAARNGRYLAAVDGQPLHLSTKATLSITRAPHDTLVVRRRERTFFDTMRQKFMWGMDARQGE